MPHFSTLRFSLVYFLTASASAGHGQELEKLARGLPVLATQEVLVYDRGAREGLGSRFHMPPEWGVAHAQCLEALAAAKLPKKDLLALLRDKDAKVRTLALIALFDRGEAANLPHLFELVKDKGETFPAPEYNFRAQELKFDPVKDPIKLRPQTVGDVAAVAIDVYLKAAGIHAPPIKGKPDVTGFEKYWAARQERAHCLSWFVVRLDRATQSTRPVGDERLGLIRALRKDIDRLPEDDRAWTLLALAGAPREETLDDHLLDLARPEELVKMCGKLGQAKLLDLLAGQKISDDPDLAPPLARAHYGRMQAFVLRHAAALLDKDVGERLLTIRKTNPQAVSSPWWHIAVAELLPERAMAILPEGIKEWGGPSYSRERAELAAAAWRIGGPKQSKFVRDWFYAEPPAPGAEPHALLLERVFKDRPKENRTLVAEIVKDPRFAETDWHTLQSLIQSLNRWTKEPILTYEELRELHHPLGSYHFVLNRPGDRDRYPKDTADVLRVLADWRQRVRDSVPEWSGGK